MQSACAVLCRPWHVRLCHIFPHYLINWKIFREQKWGIEHKMCVMIFCTKFVWNIFHSKNNSARYGHKCTSVFVKYPVFLSCFNETCLSSTDFRKMLKYQIQWKVLPVGPELFHSESRTDTVKLIVAFRKVANAPKNPLWRFAQSDTSEWTAVRR